MLAVQSNLNGRSLIKIRNSVGPRTERCGTPLLTSHKVDNYLLYGVNYNYLQAII